VRDDDGDCLADGFSVPERNGVLLHERVGDGNGQRQRVWLVQRVKLGVAEQLRDRVARSRIRRTKAEEVIDTITVSAGVAEHRKGETIANFTERADQALYASKTGGRNRVTVAS